MKFVVLAAIAREKQSEPVFSTQKYKAIPFLTDMPKLRLTQTKSAHAVNPKKKKKKNSKKTN